MNSRELDYSDYRYAIDDKRMGMRRDILLCLCICKRRVVMLPLLFSFVNNGGRVYIAG